MLPEASPGVDESGAHEWNRTIDLFLTKEVLYRLSYVGGCRVRTADCGADDGRVGPVVHAAFAINACISCPCVVLL